MSDSRSVVGLATRSRDGGVDSVRGDLGQYQDAAHARGEMRISQGEYNAIFAEYLAATGNNGDSGRRNEVLGALRRAGFNDLADSLESQLGYQGYYDRVMFHPRTSENTPGG